MIVLLQILTFCSLMLWCRSLGPGRDGSSPGGRRRSNNSLVRAQSQSMVRGEHPFMAFMLPSVSLSEAGSETDSLSVSSEQDQTGLSLASLLPSQDRPGQTRPPLAGQETQEAQIGRIGLRLTFRPEISELQVGGGEGGNINYIQL